MISLFQASIINTVSGVASLAAGFGSTVVIARLLGAEGTGLTAFALWLVFSAYALAERGIPAVVMRYFGGQDAKHGGHPALVRQLYPSFIWPVVLVAFAFAFYAFWPGKSLQDGTTEFWLITMLLFVAYSHGQLAVATDHGRGDYFGPAKRVAIGCLIQLPVVALGAYFFGAVGAMLGYLMRHFPQSLAITKYIRTDVGLEKPVTDQMMSYSRNSWLTSVLNVLVRTRIEFVFIGFFFSLTEVGYFAAGITFSSLIYQLALAMTAGLSARFAGHRDQGDIERLTNIYQRALRWLALLLLPVSLGGAAIIHEVLPLVFGDEFRPAIEAAAVLIAFAFASCLISLPASLMLAHEKDRALLVINAISAVALIALNLAFIPFFGLLAAAWVKGLVALAGLLGMLWYCQVRLGYASGTKNLLGLAFSAIACAIVARVILVGVDGFPGLVVAVPAGALVYLLGIRATGAMFADDIDSLRTTLRKILPNALARPVLWVISKLVPRQSTQ
jgi:O-antigen/teichoic acid export membrane protein